MHDIPAALGDSVRQQTLTAMYSEHHGWLHGWLRKKLGCSQHAADLAHDAFIRVLMLAEPQTIKEPRAFLATTAGRLLIDGARRRRIEKAYMEALVIQCEDAGMPDRPRFMWRCKPWNASPRCSLACLPKSAKRSC